MVWYGLAIGAVVGSGPGGAIDKEKKDSTGQGLFSLFGNQVWLYLGGIVGWGETFGPYLTTGPMIGADPDWAIGGGIHIKRFGLGVVIPIQQAMQTANRHPEKVAYLIDQGSQLLAQTQYYAGETIHALSQLGGLESLVG